MKRFDKNSSKLPNRQFLTGREEIPIAISIGKAAQEILTVYGLERTVYRLSISEYAPQFTLKGGIFLYTLFDGEFVRATRDIDLLARKWWEELLLCS